MNNNLNRIILIAIALGLWANAIIPLLPKPARADSDETETAIQSMASDISDISSAVGDIQTGVQNIATGTCTNDKIC